MSPVNKEKLLTQFKAEVNDRLQILSDGILQLEKKNNNKELLNSLMREAHTIKGSSRMLGFDLIADIAHKMEDGFEYARENSVNFTNTHFDILFEALDTIESILGGAILRKAKGIDEDNAKSLCTKISDLFSRNIVSDEKSPKNEQQNDAKHNKNNHLQSEGQSIISVTTNTQASTPEETNEHEKTSTSLHQDECIRIDLAKIEKLVNLSGEMLSAKIRLNELSSRFSEKIESNPQLHDLLNQFSEGMEEVSEKIDFIFGDIQDEILNLRLIPISNLFAAFPRNIRDLAHEHNKNIVLKITGEETHLDKRLIEEMRPPIMHLLRNCVDHGIEEPQKRLEKGKENTGIITIKAYQAGSQVIIQISDDGGGIDVRAVKKNAVKQQILTQTEAEQLSNEQAYKLLFRSGFSTKESVTDTSGRGFGLGVVSESISKLKGIIEVKSQKDVGTTFTIKLPLTVSIIKSLLIGCGNDVFAVPVDNIKETTRIKLNNIKTVCDKEAIFHRGQIIPLLRINKIFSLPRKGIFEKKYYPIIIIQSAEQQLALFTDQIIGHQDIVIKPLGYPLKKVLNISGGTILGDGRVILILDIASLIKTAESNSAQQSTSMAMIGKTSDNQSKTILLAEDTLTTAMIEKDVLESSGFNVVHALNGKQALDMAIQNQYDLVITDVLMPEMDGFELTRNLKGHTKSKEVPVIIVTTREGDEDIKKGLRAGADAYILKKDFTSDYLLETIHKLLR